MSSNSPDFLHHPHPPQDIQPPVSPHVQQQQHAEEARYAYLPESLRGRFPQIWILALEKNNCRVLTAALLLLAYITLFATLIGPPHQTEIASILTSALAPIGFTVWYVLFPLNPYQTFFFTRHGLQNLNEKDAAASQFVSTLSSPAAARFLWRRTQRFWILFFVPMAIAVLATHKFPAWQANPSWLVRVPLFCFLLLALFRIEMFRWALGVIKQSE
jgi:hypothetical protein